MRRRLSSFSTMVNVVAMMIVVLLGGYMWARRAESATLPAVGVAPGLPGGAPYGAPYGSAFAKPAGSASGSTSASAALVVSVSASISASASASGSASGPPLPVDVAVAPSGGVPYHPQTSSTFRSPFAKADGTPPIRISVALTLNSVDDYDIKTGRFTADFYLSLTSPEPMPDLDLQVANGALDKKTVIADRPTFKLYRMTGNFKSPADLRKYPFDAQELKIVLEDDRRGTDAVRLTVDKERTTLGRGFRAVGWQVSFVQARALSIVHGQRFEGDDLYYGRYVFSLGLERFATSAIFKVFVPAFVIVLISLLGMWVPPEEMEVRSNAGAPMLAGAVLFHFSLMQELPATSYMTRADKLMLGVYVSLLLGMISTWWMFVVDEHNVRRVFKIARVLVPAMTAGVMAAAIIV